MQIARFVFSLFGINTYVVWDEVTLKAAIVDPGMSNARERDALVRFLENHHLITTHLINTHMHIDHAAGVGFVADKYNLNLSAHIFDQPLSDGLASQAEMFGLDFKPESVEINTPLNDGDKIEIGEGCLEVLHVPGHSPGSIGLYDAEGKYVISGDALFNGSIGRTDLPGGNYSQLIGSIRSKFFTLPDDTVVYPGHGEPTTIGHEKRFNPFLKD